MAHPITNEFKEQAITRQKHEYYKLGRSHRVLNICRLTGQNMLSDVLRQIKDPQHRGQMDQAYWAGYTVGSPPLETERVASLDYDLLRREPPRSFVQPGDWAMLREPAVDDQAHKFFEGRIGRLGRSSKMSPVSSLREGLEQFFIIGPGRGPFNSLYKQSRFVLLAYGDDKDVLRYAYDRAEWTEEDTWVARLLLAAIPVEAA